MKFAWRALLVLGAIDVYVALTMETTVGRVYNVGLLHQQQLVLILGCVMLLAGVVLYAAKKLKQTREEDAEEETKAAEAAGRRREFATAAASRSGEAVTAGVSAARSLWRKVRPQHVLFAGLVVVGLTLLFPPYLYTTYLEGGIEFKWPVRRFIGLDQKPGPLLMFDLVQQVSWEVVVFGTLAFFARKRK